MTSLKKGLSINLKGVDKQTAPETTVVTKIPAPNNPPNNNSALCWLTDANAEKISGAPLPKAKIVTPAML